MATFLRDKYRAMKETRRGGGDGGGSKKNLVGNARRRGKGKMEHPSSVIMSLNHLSTKQGSVMAYYRLEEELGRGAFARVFRGIRKGDGREVAIKVVSLRAIAERAVQEQAAKMKRMRQQKKDTSMAERSKTQVEDRATERVLQIMQSEIEVMRRIAKIPARKKKNIVNLHDVCIDEKRIALVLDLLRGGELFDRIVKKKRYTEKDAAFHFRRIMRALRTLHQHGIIHRDLKPENFVFASPEENAQIKVTDFGLAKISGREDIHKNSIVGSPGYIAPEVLERKEYSEACDVWSMGVILYILFCGGPPFHGKNDREIFRAIKKGAYRFPRDAKVSSLGRDLVDKMLVVDPKYRISVTGVLNHPWLVQKAAQQDVVITVGRLANFNAGRKLKAVTTALTWGSKSGLRKDLYKILDGTDRSSGFTGEEIVVIKDALFRFKPSRTIARRQFLYVMRDLGYGTLPLDDIYDLFDGAYNNKADMVEVLIGLSTAASDWNGNSQIRFCFDLYEKEGNGKVSLNDMGKMLRVVASEMEASVVDKLSGLLNRWRPTEGASIDELEQQIRASGDRQLNQINQRPLGAIEDMPIDSQVDSGSIDEEDDGDSAAYSEQYGSNGHGDGAGAPHKAGGGKFMSKVRRPFGSSAKAKHDAFEPAEEA